MRGVQKGEILGRGGIEFIRCKGRRSESKGEYWEGEELSSLGVGGGGQSPEMGTSGKGRN